MLSVDQLRIYGCYGSGGTRSRKPNNSLAASSRALSDLAGQLARLKEIRLLIDDERRAVAAQLKDHEGSAMSGRTLSYSRPADVLALMLENC